MAIRAALEPSHRTVVLSSADALLEDPSLLESLEGLILECCGGFACSLAALDRVRLRAPAVVVVVINGGLAQREIALLFRHGARDYFRAPYVPHLVAERMAHLLRAERASGPARGRGAGA